VTRETIFLTVVMGLIPAAVFGHLLHMGAASPKPVRRPVSKPDTRPDTRADKRVTRVEAPSVAAPDITEQSPRRMSNGSMRSFALSEITDNPDVTDDDLTDKIMDRFGPDTKPNSVYVAVKRARRDKEAMSA
jgi:hypothetical protein